MRPLGPMATSWTSSAIARARRHSARRSTRPAPSSPCRLRRLRAMPALTMPAPTISPKRLAACGRDAAPSTAPMPKPISGPGDSRAAASRRCASTPSFATAKARPSFASRPWSPPSPAPTAPSMACTAPGLIRTAPPRPTSPRPGKPSAASTAWPCASARPPTVSLRSSSAKASRPCCRWSPPCPGSRPPPRSRLGVSALSRPRPPSGASSSPATTISRANGPPNASLGAAVIAARFGPLFRFAGAGEERA